jgi:hypothetical protein
VAWRRVAAITPALALIAWAMLTAASTARIDGELAPIAAKLADPKATAYDWPALRGRLEGIGPAGLSNPATHEFLGVAAVRGDPSPESLAKAVSHFSDALRLRPVSGYTWANLAAAKYLLGDTGMLFEQALLTAAELAPNEPAVQGLIAHFGLAVLDEVRPATRAAIERVLRAAMRRNPLETLHIAARRGRLDLACGHLMAVARKADPKWSGICQSSEARQ